MRVEISIAKESRENAKGFTGGFERRDDPPCQ